MQGHGLTSPNFRVEASSEDENIVIYCHKHEIGEMQGSSTLRGQPAAHLHVHSSQSPQDSAVEQGCPHQSVSEDVCINEARNQRGQDHAIQVRAIVLIFVYLFHVITSNRKSILRILAKVLPNSSSPIAASSQ